MSGASVEEDRSFRRDRMLSKSSLLILCVTEFGNAVWKMRAPVKLFSCGRVAVPLESSTTARTKGIRHILQANRIDMQS